MFVEFENREKLHYPDLVYSPSQNIRQSLSRVDNIIGVAHNTRAYKIVLNQRKSPIAEIVF